MSLDSIKGIVIYILYISVLLFTFMRPSNQEKAVQTNRTKNQIQLTRKDDYGKSISPKPTSPKPFHRIDRRMFHRREISPKYYFTEIPFPRRTFHKHRPFR